MSPTVSIDEARLAAVAADLGVPRGDGNARQGRRNPDLRRRRSAPPTKRFEGTSTMRPVGPPPLADLGHAVVDWDRRCGLLRRGAASTDHARGRARGPVVRALDLIEDSADEPPTVRDLCRFAGVSERNLALRVPRAIRGVAESNTCRRFGSTRSASSCVAESTRRLPTSPIGGASGTWASFAADYRRHFGELPSATLQRARGDDVRWRNEP